MTVTTGYWTRREGFLRALPLFASSPEEELRAFDRLASELRVLSGTELTREGSRGTQFVVIADGRAVVERDGRPIAALGPGDFVGELALLDGRPRNATVRAATPMRLLALGRDEFRAAMTAVPTVREAVHAAARHRRVGAPVVPAAATRSHRASRRRRRSVAIALGVALSLLVAGGIAWVVTQRTHVTEVGFDDALTAFRTEAAPAADADAAPPEPSTSGATAAPTGDSGATAAALPVASGRPASPTRGVAATGTAAPSASAGAAPVATAVPSYALPDPGVYAYATDGYDSISVFGARHNYPSRTFAVIRHQGGCAWQAEHRIIDEHVDFHDRCTDDRGVFTVADGREVEFFSQRDGETWRCNPTPHTLAPGDGPGVERRHACAADDGGSRGEFVFTRRPSETLTIDGTPIPAERVTLSATLSGRSDGTSQTEFWLHPRTGLILQEVRVVDIDAKAAFGNVRYKERVTIRLESLRPAR